MKTLLFVLFAALTLQAGQITVAVAANVGYAMDDLKKAFEKTHPDIHVRVILGGSGKLTAQIRRGAPYGLFLAANMGYPKALRRSGDAISDPVVYARGSLALLSKQPRNFSQGIRLLLASDIRRIAVANSRTAPYGEAAQEALVNAHLFEKVASKLVYAESIAQTVAYTLTAADIGIVAASALYSRKLSRFEHGRHWVELDPALYTPIDQGVVLLKHSRGRRDYRLFYDFILGQAARAIFKRYGYILPTTGPNRKRSKAC